MYKHAPRIFFISPQLEWSEFAAGFANRSGQDLVMASSVAIERLAEAFANREDYPDLCVFLLMEGQVPSYNKPLDVQEKRWAIPEQGCFEQIQTRVEGLLGGVRMMSKSGKREK